MFFISRVVAWLATLFGFLGVVSGYEIQINTTASVFAEIIPLDTDQRVASQAKVFIHQGAMMMYCGLVLGVLTEIGRSVARLGKRTHL